MVGERITRLLSSRRTRWGLGGALIAAALAAVTGRPAYSAAAAVGGFAIGALAVPRTPHTLIPRQGTTGRAAVTRSLDSVVRVVQRQTAADIVASVERIRASVLRIAADVDTDTDANWFTIEQIALDYLPASIENYLAIPPAHRRTSANGSEGSAHDQLLNQLSLLADRLRRIAHEVHQGRLDDVIGHGEFLEARFSDPLTW